MKKDSAKYGFHIGFEGGYADTLVTDCPIFQKRMVIQDMSITYEDSYCGHVAINSYRMEDKLDSYEQPKKRGIFAIFNR